MPGAFGGGGQTRPATFSQGGNPATYVPEAQGAADTSYQQILQGLINPSLSFLGQGQQFPAVQAYPQAQDLTQQLINNPYGPQAIHGAQTAATYGMPAGQTEFYWGQNTLPMQAGVVTGAVPQLQGGISQIMGTAFDPQQALYNHLIQQTMGQANAQNAMSGLAGTPYGANLANQAQQNFDMNWQNQQLARQQAGLGAAGQAAGQIGGLENLSANLLQHAGGMMNEGLGTIAQTSGLPYSALTGQLQTGLGGLSNLVNLGNQQYVLPQQAMNDLQSYLQLGQAASGLAGQLGGMGFQQNQMGLGNMLGLGALGSNLLTGSSNPFGSGGLLGLAGLGGSSMPEFSGLAGATSGLFDFGAASAPFDVASGAGLSDLLLPMAFL